MAREQDPSPWLAKLSSHWEEEKRDEKLDNPIKSAICMWRWRRFLSVEIPIFLVWLIVICAFNPSPSLWHGFVTIALILPLFFWFVDQFGLDENQPERKKNRDAKQFIKAITLLESLVGKTIDEWPDQEDLEGPARNYLEASAGLVKTAEKIDKQRFERRPWAISLEEKESAPTRWVFKSGFELLTNLLPLPKDQKVYFDNS